MPAQAAFLAPQALGDSIQLDPAAGTIAVASQSFSFPALPKEVLAIGRAGTPALCPS